MASLTSGQYAIGCWVTMGAATILTIARFAIRWSIRQGFYIDDGFHLLSWLTALGYSISIQLLLPLVGEIVNVESPPPSSIVEYRKRQVALTTIFFICIWSVKFTFMFFYRLLFWASPGFQKAWWVSIVVLFVTFWIPIAANLTNCGPVTRIFDPVACSADENYQRAVLIYSCVINVATDFLVMALPWSMIRKVQIPKYQKIGLAIVFSVALVTVACDILRTVVSMDGTLFSDSILYGYLEANLAVIVACMPTLRGLFGIQRRIAGASYLDLGLPHQRREDCTTLTDTEANNRSNKSKARRDSFARYGFPQADQADFENRKTRSVDDEADKRELPDMDDIMVDD